MTREIVCFKLNFMTILSKTELIKVTSQTKDKFQLQEYILKKSVPQLKSIVKIKQKKPKYFLDWGSLPS